MPLPTRLPRPLVLGLAFPLVVLNLWVFGSLYRAFEAIASSWSLVNGRLLSVMI